MKSVTLLATLILGLCASANAALYNFTGTTPNGGVIQDGNLSGWTGAASVSDLAGSITSVQVHLNVSGGYNGDLYAYLSFNGTLIPLLNRLGVGTGDAFGSALSGMNITLADGGANGDIHLYSGAGAPTGIFSADGRTISPLSSPSSFDAAGSATFANAFGGMNPNGEWTLFFADVSGGGGDSTITSWSLDIITAVPEPINVALGVFGGLFLVGSLCRSERLRKLFVKPEPAEVD